jgi:hypothetical protein
MPLTESPIAAALAAYMIPPTAGESSASAMCIVASSKITRGNTNSLRPNKKAVKTPGPL